MGEDLVDAAQMALFDVGRTDLELLPRDTGDEPGKAEAAARSALDAGAELLLGPVYGRSAQSVAPVAAGRGVNVISFSNDASVARPGLYVLGFRPEEQVDRICVRRGARANPLRGTGAGRRLWRPRARSLAQRHRQFLRNGRDRRHLSTGGRRTQSGGAAGCRVRPSERAAAEATTEPGVQPPAPSAATAAGFMRR